MALIRTILSLSSPRHSTPGWSSLLPCSEAQEAVLSLRPREVPLLIPLETPYRKSSTPTCFGEQEEGRELWACLKL